MSIGKKKKLTVFEAVIPIRALLYRFSVFLMMAFALFIIVVNRVSPESIEKFRTKTTDFVAPVFSVLTSPVQTFNNVKDGISHMFNIYGENKVLRQENERLIKMKTAAIELEAENRRLRELLNLIPEQGSTFLTARVVGSTGGPYSSSAIINFGGDIGIKKGQVVRNKEGLVGRVAEVGKGSARISLITDFSSRVPVMTENSGERAVLAGDNGSYPELTHLPSDTNVRVGERVITSGDGQYFPAGIVVGVVRSVSKDRTDIKTAVDFGRLGYVGIIEYNLEPEITPEAGVSPQ